MPHSKETKATLGWISGEHGHGQIVFKRSGRMLIFDDDDLTVVSMMLNEVLVADLRRNCFANLGISAPRNAGGTNG
jgi:hypothetical protein